MKAMGFRVTLSGFGGEDPTGGYLPTPTLELQDLLTRARLPRLVQQLRAWAQKMNKSPLPLLWETLRGLFTRSLTYPWAPKTLCPPPWFQPSFVQRNKAALLWYPSKQKPFGPLPSFQNQVHLVNHARMVLAYLDLKAELLREIRYPYLDRDLLEFACAIPREQIVGVGKRRFLMKRALAGIVPDELLNRKRRAVTQEPEKDISKEWPTLAEIGDQLVSGYIGVVDSSLFFEALQRAHHNEELAVESLKRTLLLEVWLRHLETQGVLNRVPRNCQAFRLLRKEPSSALPFNNSVS